MFKGLKNDEDSKQIPYDFFYKIKNFSYSDTGLLGMQKTLMPTRYPRVGTGTQIDGMFEYKYLNSSNALVTEYIGVTDGSVYKNILTTPVLIASGLPAGKVSFAVFNDKLYMATGKDYVWIYDGNLGVISQMGAPAIKELAGGTLIGYYSYAMTYLTAGGEEILGSVSNRIFVNTKRISLSLPIGYAGTLTRNLYRTTGAFVTSPYKFLTNIANNTTMTYIDNAADATLTTDIPAINNELPKPYFLAVAGQKLFGAVDDKLPTQVFISETNIELFDTASALDVANYGSDNSRVKGIGFDFNNIVVGTEKNIILIDQSTNTPIVTRANIGIKDGYSVQPVSAFGDFPGGLIFASSLNDVRLMVGLKALPVATSLDNVRSDNLAQNIRGDMESVLKNALNIDSEFYNYKYHLLIDYIKYVYDIRLNAWTLHDIRTSSYQSKPIRIKKLGSGLFNGQVDGYLEREYSSITYRGEDVEAYLESPHIEVDTMYKFIEKFKLWFIPGNNTNVTLQITLDDNTAFMIDIDFLLKGGCFDIAYFDPNYYLTDAKGLDYKVANINSLCRWLKYKLICTVGNINYQGFELYYQGIANKEIA